MREEVNRKSRAGIVDWAEYFPHSSRAVSTPDIPTFDQVSESYLRRKYRKTKPSTFEGYQKRIKLWRGIFGPMLITQIRRSHIMDAIDVMGWTNGKTMSNALTCLRGVFEEAMLDDLIVKSPVLAIDLPRSQRPPCNPLSSRQMHELLAGWANAAWLPYFQTGFGSGMRPSELMGLCWPDVNFKAGTAHVHNARTDGVDTGSTKSYRPRTIELSPLALRGLKSQRFRSKGQEHVFLNPHTGTAINSTQDPRRVWHKECALAGIERRKPYEARHTHATIRLAAGEPLIQVSRDLGHLNPSMTLDHYTGWVKEEQTDLAKRAFA